VNAVTGCTKCGAEIPYVANDSPLLRDLKPTICRRCSADAAKEELEAMLASDREDRNVPLRYRSASFADFTPHTPSQQTALDAMRDHAAQGVMLMGNAGSGKTHLACAAINTGPAGALFTNTTAMLDDIRRGFDGAGSDIYQRAMSARLLALDDLGAEAVTDWVRDRLYTLINHRWDNCLPLIVTTNVPAADLAERIGQGVASRLAGCCRHRLIVKGPDGRRAAP